jgi:toxin YoeB
MEYIVTLNPEAEEHILAYKMAGNRVALERIERIRKELKVHPRTGIGKPEKLRHDPQERWSRRIDKKNRMTYQIKDNIVTVLILSLIDHYGNK